MIGIDCTQLSCPEFTVPALRLIKQHGQKDKELVIKTLEERAPKKIHHLCLVHHWQMLAVAKSNNTIFIKIKL